MAMELTTLLLNFRPQVKHLKILMIIRIKAHPRGESLNLGYGNNSPLGRPKTLNNAGF